MGIELNGNRLRGFTSVGEDPGDCVHRNLVLRLLELGDFNVKEWISLKYIFVCVCADSQEHPGTFLGHVYSLRLRSWGNRSDVSVSTTPPSYLRLVSVFSPRTTLLVVFSGATVSGVRSLNDWHSETSSLCPPYLFRDSPSSLPRSPLKDVRGHGCQCSGRTMSE